MANAASSGQPLHPPAGAGGFERLNKPSVVSNMKGIGLLNRITALLTVNYQEPLLKYVVFPLKTGTIDDAPNNPRKLLFLTFFALTAVASVPLIQWSFMGGAKDLFFVDSSKHANLEVFCSLISGIIAFILAWEYYASGKYNILLLVFAFFSIGILDVFHAFSDHDHNMFVWFHSGGAFFGSALFAGSVFLNQRTDETRDTSWVRTIAVASGIGLIIVFALISIKLNTIIPHVLSEKHFHKVSAYEVQGNFSTFIYLVNFLSALLYLFAGVVLLKGFTRTRDLIYLIFGSAALLFFESELLFSFSKLWDPLWWYWHIIKVVIFSGLLIGLAFGFTQTVYRLHGSRIELANYLKEIEAKNLEIRDAYDRLKETQRYLKESEKLASMGKMAAMVAHEIRNPLGAISNSLGVLKRYSALGKDDFELIEIVEKEMDRLNSMTEEFLTFARPSLLKRQPTDVHQLINETIGLLGPAPSGAPVHISRSFDQDVPALELDRNRFKQIVLNLIINSRQAMPRGGDIAIVTRNKPADGEVEVTIADAGCGMSEEVLSRAFQPFFTTKDSGLGLGLSIVHKIVKEHGGYVVISSQLGKGTHVQLVFPVSKDRSGTPGEPVLREAQSTQTAGD